TVSSLHREPWMSARCVLHADCGRFCHEPPLRRRLQTAARDPERSGTISCRALFLCSAILSQLELSQINGVIATPPRVGTIRKSLRSRRARKRRTISEGCRHEPESLISVSPARGRPVAQPYGRGLGGEPASGKRRVVEQERRLPGRH